MSPIEDGHIPYIKYILVFRINTKSHYKTNYLL